MSHISIGNVRDNVRDNGVITDTTMGVWGQVVVYREVHTYLCAHCDGIPLHYTGMVSSYFLLLFFSLCFFYCFYDSFFM